MSLINVSTVLFGYLEKKALFRSMLSMIAFITLIMGGYVILEISGFFDKFRSFDAIKNFILSTGKWGKLIYVVLVIVQIILLPIPSTLLEVVAANLFGSMQAFLLSVIGTLIGSVAAYFIGKLLGKRVVEWIAGKENVQKYTQEFSESGKFLFALMMVFPFFPDDVICMVAGLSSLPFWYFFLVVLFARPISSAANCFLGSGNIIPFGGWGIAVWLIIFIVIAALFFAVMHANKKRNERRLFSKKINSANYEPTASEPKLITNSSLINDRNFFNSIKKNDFSSKNKK